MTTTSDQKMMFLPGGVPWDDLPYRMQDLASEALGATTEAILLTAPVTRRDTTWDLEWHVYALVGPMVVTVTFDGGTLPAPDLLAGPDDPDMPTFPRVEATDTTGTTGTALDVTVLSSGWEWATEPNPGAFEIPPGARSVVRAFRRDRVTDARADNNRGTLTVTGTGTVDVPGMFARAFIARNT